MLWGTGFCAALLCVWEGVCSARATSSTAHVGLCQAAHTQLLCGWALRAAWLNEVAGSGTLLMLCYLTHRMNWEWKYRDLAKAHGWTKLSLVFGLYEWNLFV